MKNLLIIAVLVFVGWFIYSSIGAAKEAQAPHDEYSANIKKIEKLQQMLDSEFKAIHLVDSATPEVKKAKAGKKYNKEFLYSLYGEVAYDRKAIAKRNEDEWTLRQVNRIVLTKMLDSLREANDRLGDKLYSK